MKKTSITGKKIPTASRDFIPAHARRARARPRPHPRRPVPTTLAEAWAEYVQTLGDTFLDLSPSQLAPLAFYFGAASSLTLAMSRLGHAPDEDTARAQLLALRDEIAAFASEISRDPDD
jgi:hypothetical protein